MAALCALYRRCARAVCVYVEGAITRLFSSGDHILSAVRGIQPPVPTEHPPFLAAFDIAQQQRARGSKMGRVQRHLRREKVQPYEHRRRQGKENVNRCGCLQRNCFFQVYTLAWPVHVTYQTLKF